MSIEGKKFVSSFSWNTATVVFQILIQLGYTALLARLIAPESFAVMGIVLSLMGFAEIFSQIGLGPALIQRKEVSQAHLNSAFTTSLALGVLFTTMFIVAAPFISSAYQIPLLTEVIPIVCTSFIISSLSVVPRNLMMKEMRFKAFFTASMLSIIGGNLVVGLILAYEGFQIWAYVWALFAQNALMTLACWFLQPTKVQWKWNKSATLELLNYGAGSSLFNALNYAATKVDVTVIPMFSQGSAMFPNTISLFAAGLYERGAYVASLPITIMAKLSDSVLFSGMSKLQESNDRLQRIVLASTNALSILSFAFSSFVIVFSEEVLTVYLGSNYATGHWVLKWLFIAVIFRSLTRPIDSLLRAKAAVYRGSRIKLIYFLLMVIGVLVAGRYSSEAVALSIALTTLIHYFMMVFFAKNLIELSLADQLKALLPGIRVGLVVTLLAFLMKYVADKIQAPFLLTLLLGIGGVSIGGVLLAYFRPRWLGDKSVNPLFVIPERMRKFPFLRKVYEAFDEE
jgi:O-antigen/teichoic acid export membrane protein